MKTIANPVYENLSPEQRVRAAIAAEARDDKAESQRLVSTCPKHIYREIDAAFADRMESLMNLSLAVECDLRGLTIRFFQGRLRAKRIKANDTEALEKSNDLTDEIFSDMASIDEAWRRALEGIGIDPDEMAKAGAARDPATDSLVTRAREDSDPEPAMVRAVLRVMEEQLRPGA